jgi:hypothetical protein
MNSPFAKSQEQSILLYSPVGEKKQQKLLCLCSKERIDDPEKVITLNSEAYKTRKGEERLKKFIEGASQGWEITSDDITFTSRLFAQVGLPHTNKRTEIWERRNGQYIFTVRSGLDYQKKSEWMGCGLLLGFPMVAIRD